MTYRMGTVPFFRSLVMKARRVFDMLCFCGDRDIASRMHSSFINQSGGVLDVAVTLPESYCRCLEGDRLNAH